MIMPDKWVQQDAEWIKSVRLQMTRELTESEKAYRRGALQAIQFLLADCRINHQLVVKYEQSLVAARDSKDVRYLGAYMDEIRKDVHEKLGTRP